jgi:hypothetical protein
VLAYTTLPVPGNYTKLLLTCWEIHGAPTCERTHASGRARRSSPPFGSVAEPWTGCRRAADAAAQRRAPLADAIEIGRGFEAATRTPCLRTC